MLSNLLRLVHTAVILHLFLHIFTGKTCTPAEVAAELLLTVVRAILEKRVNSYRTKAQILLSFLLGYAMFPNKFRHLSWVFIAKGIEVHKSLKQTRRNC